MSVGDVEGFGELGKAVVDEDLRGRERLVWRGGREREGTNVLETATIGCETLVEGDRVSLVVLASQTR